MKSVIQALSRALGLMLTPRVWLLIWKPTLFSVVLGLVLVFAVGMVWGDEIKAVALDARNWVDGQWSGDNWWESLITVVMGFMAFMLTAVLFVVLTVVWAMIFISVFGMSHINHLVASKFFPNMQRTGGLSTAQSIWHTLKWTLWFAVFWLVSVPAYILAGLGALIQGGVIARYNQKVFTFDALADHATHEEFAAIAEQHNFNLFVLGAVVTFLGALPTFVWVGSVIGAVLLPITAILSILTFTALFTFCGLAYSCYCLQALDDLRAKVSGQSIEVV